MVRIARSGVCHSLFKVTHVEDIPLYSALTYLAYESAEADFERSLYQ